MKNILLITLSIFIISGCIRVEGEENTDTVDNHSTVSIKSEGNNFVLTWSKKTKGYGQLEITDNTESANPIINVSKDVREVTLSCNYQQDLPKDSLIYKKYICNIDNAGVVGSFYLTLITDKTLYIIERENKTDQDKFELLSEFLIYSTHGIVVN